MRLIPIILAAVLAAAHFLRSGPIGLVVVCALIPTILLIRRRFILLLGPILAAGGMLVWADTTWGFVQVRQMMGLPYLRLVFILGGVIAFTGVAGWIFRTKKMKRWYGKGEETALPAAVAFCLTALALAMVQLKVEIPMLLLERFVPGGGWIEVFGFGLYAAWITEKMMDVTAAPIWRRRIWLIFSFVFFSQFVIGLLGADRFLLTGTLHIPVPALIVAGPLFRGEGLFMPILFAVTLALVGPAWCSHLCYIGSWDMAAAGGRKRPKKLPGNSLPLRMGILALVMGAAVVLRLVGASIMVAAALAIAFGAVGVGVMWFWSRRVGVMTHCTVYCPIGLLAAIFGKISPFRVRILPTCTDCGKCTAKCRYNALNKEQISLRRPGLNCTLCGDCLHACDENQIEYRFAGHRGAGARTAFIVLIVSLHAVFMAVARI